MDDPTAALGLLRGRGRVRVAVTAVVVVAVGFALMLLIAFVVLRDVGRSGCLQRWATAFTQRTDALVGATSARQEALDRVVRDVAALPATRAAFQHDLSAYIATSDAYKVQVARHPVPPAPQENC